MTHATAPFEQANHCKGNVYGTVNGQRVDIGRMDHAEDAKFLVDAGNAYGPLTKEAADLRAGWHASERRRKIATAVAAHHHRRFAGVITPIPASQALGAVESVLAALRGADDPAELGIADDEHAVAQVRAIIASTRLAAAAGRGHHVLVTVDPPQNNGRASIGRTMTPISAVAGALRAGSTVEAVQDEYDLTEAEVAVVAAIVEDFADLDLGEENAPPPEDTCRPELVVVDGQEELVRVVGAERMDDQDRAMLAELVAATKAYVAVHNPHLGVIQELLAAARWARRCIPDGVVHTRVGTQQGAAVKQRLEAAVQAARDVLISPKTDDGGENVDIS